MDKNIMYQIWDGLWIGWMHDGLKWTGWIYRLGGVKDKIDQYVYCVDASIYCM